MRPLLQEGTRWGHSQAAGWLLALAAPLMFTGLWSGDFK